MSASITIIAGTAGTCGVTGATFAGITGTTSTGIHRLANAQNDNAESYVCQKRPVRLRPNRASAKISPEVNP